MRKETRVATPHAFIFPLPLQGPVNCMLKLAELLCLDNIKVTFLNTQHIQQRLSNCTDTEIYFKIYPNFRFETVPDGLPEDHRRTANQFSELMESIQAVVWPIFQEMVTSSGVYGPDSGNPVADGLQHSAIDVARHIGVPLLFFDTISPCGICTYLCLPKLFQSGEIPFHDDNLDEIIRYAPRMEGVMRRHDLPSFCRGAIDYNNPQGELVLKEINNIPLSWGLILNTFQDLDALVLSEILKVCPNIYAIGPLHAHLKTRLAAETGPRISAHQLQQHWKEDRSCISWLDQKPSKSVIYVSIGSLFVVTKDQFFEIWHGLVKSGSRFLWIRRPGSVTGLDRESDEIPVELSRGTKERGYIVSWAPQEEVLAQHAIGGFLTHSGWNSTLESIAEGKPMICWPHYVDQQVTSRHVGEVWKIGLDMKDSCNRVIVEKMIRELMDLRKDELLERAEETAKLAKSSISEGADMDRLIEDIRIMKLAC